MKILLILLFYSVALNLFACYSSEKLEVVAVNNLSVSANQTPQPSQSNKPIEKPKKQYPVVWIAVFSLAEFKKSAADITVWSGENDDYDNLLDKNSAAYKVGSGVEIDLMNCAGYLASGKIYIDEDADTETESPQWLLKIYSGTIAKDAEEKMKQCIIPAANGKVSKDNDILNKAFAIAPQDKKRNEIKIDKIAPKELFASLPKNIRKLVNASTDKDVSKQLASSFTLENGNWTDLNGDDIIDLVEVDGYAKDGRGNVVILMLINGKWKEITRLLRT